MTTLPRHEIVDEAAKRIAGRVHRTPVLTSQSLDEAVGAQVFMKAEHLQRIGAFKIRGATNAVFSLDDETAARGVAAHSSGNHAQALALAARWRGVPAHVVMPRTAPAAKRDAVLGYGATIVECDPSVSDREATLARVIAETGAVEIHPYDDERVIAGQGTATLELLEQVDGLDTVVVPVGGGGLLSGTILALAGHSPGTAAIGAEPLAADDAARGFRSGVLQPALPPTTVADGLNTSLSERTLGIIRAGASDVVTVDEDAIISAMRFTWTRTKQVVEPSGAVPIATLLAGLVPGKRIGVVLTGGNLDLDRLPWTAR